MSRNGSGTYSLPAGNPVVSGTTITSTWANTTLNDIASALTGSLAADGQTTASGTLDMGVNQIINVVDPSTAQGAATKNYVDTADTTNLALALLKASNLSDVANVNTARGNLSAAKSGANSDITSLTGLTTALSVGQGGTGVATITGIIKGSGTSAFSAATAGTDYVSPSVVTNFTAQQYFGNVALTDAATIAWAANTAQVATFTFVSSNRTMGAPTGLVNGGFYALAVLQNAGSNTLTWNSVFKWQGGTAPTLSTGASAKDYFVFRSDGTNLYEQGRALGDA